jgi:hypothetical protein
MPNSGAKKLSCHQNAIAEDKMNKSLTGEERIKILKLPCIRR